MLTRPRAEVLADITNARHAAGRMTCADPDYEAVHHALNDLLDELDTCAPGTTPHAESDESSDAQATHAGE